MNEGVNRICPLCGKDEQHLFLKKNSLRLVRCKNCSMIYANPVPQEMASGAFYDNEASAYYLSPAKLESDYAPVRFERELRVFRRFCQSGSVLDIGCSTGAFLYQLNQRFPGSYSVFGTDVSGAPLDFAEKKGVAILRGDFLKEDFQGKSFDAITFWAVIEHLVDPKSFLDKAALLLKPGGCCFILVPNIDSLAVRILKKNYRYILPQHVNYFSRQTLRQFAGSPFEIQLLSSTHFNPLVILQDYRGNNAVVSESDRAQLLKRTTSYKENPLLKPVKILYQFTENFLSPCYLCDNLLMVLQKK